MNQIYWDILAPKGTIILLDLRKILQVLAGTAGVLEGPPVFPVKHDCRLGVNPGIQDSIAQVR